MSGDRWRSKSERRDEGGTSPPLERLIGALGAILVIALVAFLAYQAAVLPDTGPRLSTTVARIERAGDQFVTHVRVANSGGETAEGVTVAGRLRTPNGEGEKVTTTISFIPAQSTRRAALVFGHDPRDGELDVRAAAYELP